MSFNENYDKIALTVGGILGLACIGVGYMLYSGLDDQYAEVPTIRSKEITIPGIAQADILEKKITGDHTIARPRNGAHDFNMFVGPSLWHKDGAEVPVDITDGSAQIHPPVPNSWFLEHGLEDSLVYSDALTRDPDGDGFSNLEEFQAGTNPKDAANHPLLVTKLTLDGIRTRSYNIVFSSDYAPEYSFRATNAGGTSFWSQTIEIGEKLGKEPTGVDRFVLKEVVQKEVEVAGVKQNEPFAILEDQKENKKGKLYEVRKGTSHPTRISDSTASLTITAGSEKGKDFQVEEGSAFKIPGDEKTEYTLQSVDAKEGTITVTANIDGAERTWRLKR